MYDNTTKEINATLTSHLSSKYSKMHFIRDIDSLHVWNRQHMGYLGIIFGQGHIIIRYDKDPTDSFAGYSSDPEDYITVKLDTADPKFIDKLEQHIEKWDKIGA